MADRADVLRLPKRLGFGAPGAGEPVAVVQATALLDVLPTILVVPLDAATATHRGNPLAVPVPKAEVGLATDHVALVHQVRPVAADSLAPGVIGRLGPATMAAIEHALRLVFAL